MTFRPRSAAWTCALAAVAALLAAAAFALVPSPSHAAAAPAACKAGPTSARGAAFIRRQRPLLNAIRRRCAPGPRHQIVTAELQPDPAPPSCSPTLFTPYVFDTNEGTNFSALSMVSTGALPAVMLFVDFPGLPASESTTRIYDSLVPRSRSWMTEASYGHASLDVTGVHGWYRMPRPQGAYGLGDGVSFDEQRDYIADAVAAADADVDFSAFRIVYVVGARGSNLEQSPAFHAIQGSGVFADGTELRWGTTLGEDIRSPDPLYASHVLLHETGHMLGLPDLYDVPNPVYPRVLRWAGGWDLMSWTVTGPHFLAWHKWKLGWLDPAQLACLHGPGTLTTTITPLARRNGLKAIVVPTGPSTAIVVEARRKIGHDSRLCEQGVLVYSVDATVLTGHGPIRVRAAQRDRGAERVHACGMLHEAPFDRAPGEVARFEDTAAGLTVEVLSSNASGYRVRVTRR